MNEKLCRKLMTEAGLIKLENESVSYKEDNSPGLGYSSLLQRFILFTNNDSDGKGLSVIVKSNPDKEHLPGSLFDKMFHCEIKVYTKILPIFKELFDRSKNAIIWPELLFVSDTDDIIMEDLKLYRVNSCKSGSTFEEAVMAINALAMFHGSSFVAKSEGKINEDTLEPYFYCRRDENINHFFKDGLRILAISMRQSWGREWFEMANKLQNIGEKIGDILMALHLETDDKFKVINHGDCWKANFMYLHNQDNLPTSFKIVDFQLSHYGSFGWDLAYFFYSNPNTNLKYQHYNKLISCYCETMNKFILSCGTKFCLSFDDINKELDRFLLYGFLKCCTDLPYQLCSDAGIDAKNLFENNEEIDRLKVQLFAGNQQYVKIIKMHFDDVKKRNLL